MQVLKVVKDCIMKSLWGKKLVPVGLVELNKYFRNFGSIAFNFHKEGDVIIAASNNFRYGSIITYGRDENELDANIKDAILTSFEVPSSYKEEAHIIKEGEKKEVYALA